MKNTTGILAILAMLSATGVAAQTTTFDAQDAASDAVDDLNETIEDDAERTLSPYSNSGRPLGWDGSLSLRAAATDGNTETYDVGIGGRVGYFDGVNGHKFNLSYSYSQDEDTATDNDLYMSYDYTRDFARNVYGYAEIQTLNSEFGTFENDTFAGFGMGYRAVQNASTDWAIQTGPGYRWAEYQSGEEIDEFAWSVGSFFSHDVNETVSLFNDTNVVWSDSDVATTNELGVSVAMADNLALRTSLLTEHHSEPEDGYDDIDNSLGVSVVYNFD